MHPFLRWLSLLALAFVLPGCYQLEQVVNVKPDGSGTLVYTMKIGEAGRALLKEQAEGRELSEDQMLDQVFKEKQAQERLEKLGEGVKLETFKQFKDGEFIGRTATYSFTDITKLTPNLNLGPTDGQNGQSVVRFEFTKGSPASLVVRLPANQKKEDKPEDKGDAAQMAMVAKAFKDMRMTLAVNVEGALVKTDADLQEGNRVTLIDAKIAELFSDYPRFKKINAAKTWPEMAKLMSAVPGVKLESKEKVEIQWK